MTSLEKRVALLERKFARIEAENITSGITEPHHIGKHTVETLTQEWFSSMNTKPAFRNKKWETRNAEIKSLIEKLSKEEQSKINSAVEAMLHSQ